MEIVKNYRYVQRQLRIKIPKPVRNEVEYSKQQYQRNLEISPNENKEQDSNKVKSKNVPIIMPKTQMTAQYNKTSIERMDSKDFRSKLAEFLKDQGNKNSNRDIISKSATIVNELKSGTEDPETYFNGHSNAVSRISEKVDMDQLLEEEKLSNIIPVKSEIYKLKTRLNVASAETPFSELRPLLKQLFLNNNIDGFDRLLNGEEVAILSAVLEKKLGTKLSIKQLYNINEIKIYDTLLPKKRTEECYKYVFKQTFKHLQTKFLNSIKSKYRGEEYEASLQSFYTYYFGDAAEAKDIYISNYYLPLTSDVKGLNVKNVVSKTINSTYISLICRSDVFVKDCMDYLKNGFMKDYEALVNKKIEKTVNKWETFYSSSFCKFRAVESLCDLIVYNKKTKFPWFCSEVEDARKTVLNIISKMTDLDASQCK